MRRLDSGRGRARTILTLAVALAVVYVAIKTVPICVQNYQLQDYLRQLVVRASVERTPPEAIRSEVVTFAQDLGLPVDRQNVKVTVTTKVSLSVDYTVPVDLKIYTWVLHFTPSAENRPF